MGRVRLLLANVDLPDAHQRARRRRRLAHLAQGAEIAAHQPVRPVEQREQLLRDPLGRVFHVQAIGYLAAVPPLELRLRRVQAEELPFDVLGQFAIRALQKHRLRQEDERQAALDRWTETGLVFTSPFGARLDPQIATRSFTRVLRRVNLPHQRFHDLRHACASLLLAQGLDLKVIQEILGHSTITITRNLYAHVMLGLKRHASAEMDALLGGAPAASASEPVALAR